MNKLLKSHNENIFEDLEYSKKNSEPLSSSLPSPTIATKPVTSQGSFRMASPKTENSGRSNSALSVLSSSSSQNSTTTDLTAESIISVAGGVYGKEKLAMLQGAHAVKLLPAEKELLRDNIVFVWNGTQWVQGILVLTNYRLVFQPTNVSTYEDVPSHDGCSIPLTTIHKVEKIGGKSNKQEHQYLLEVYSKDFRYVRFSFIPTRGSRSAFFKTLKEEKPPKTFFCFSYTPSKSEKPVDGWAVYDPVREFLRQGAITNPTTCFNQTDENVFSWRMSKVNEDFKMSETYPKYICIPSGMSDEDLRAVALFRSKGRIPVLTYYDKETGCSISRSSQPLIGMTNLGKSKKLKDDYKMIEGILGANKRSDKLMILDLRPKLNAEANRAFKGAGYEKNYKNCDIKFMNIENIHVMRASFTKLMELCMQTGGVDPQWHSKVEATGWLEHVRYMLIAAKHCIDLIEKEKTSILVHCSDGWDRTSQVCALVQLMIDPYFRTLEGLAVVIEKDWLGFGHQFYKRHGHGSRNPKDEERGPIFLQFLESVFQLLRQHPTAFEFNESLLMFLMDEVYACRFGTFVFDFEKDREEHKIRETTPSVWSFILDPANRSLFYNPFYDLEQTSHTILPDLRHSSLQLWTGYWLRYCKDPYDFHRDFIFRRPEITLYERGYDFLDNVTKIEEAKVKLESKNEATVATFQRELRSMWGQIEELKAKNIEWKQKYETDTTQLLALCEKQKEELAKWGNGVYTAEHRQEESSSPRGEHPHHRRVSSGLSIPENINNNAEDVEQLKKELEMWKQKALDLQAELLNDKPSQTSPIVVDPLMQKLPGAANVDPSPVTKRLSTDKFEQVANTWRAVSSSQK